MKKIISLIVIITLIASCKKDFISAAQDPVDSRTNIYGKKLAIKYLTVGTSTVNYQNQVAFMDFANDLMIIGSDSSQSAIMFTANYSGTQLILTFSSYPSMSGTYEVLYTEMSQGVPELILKTATNEIVLIK